MAAMHAAPDAPYTAMPTWLTLTVAAKPSMAGDDASSTATPTAESEPLHSHSHAEQQSSAARRRDREVSMASSMDSLLELCSLKDKEGDERTREEPRGFN